MVFDLLEDSRRRSVLVGFCHPRYMIEKTNSNCKQHRSRYFLMVSQSGVAGKKNTVQDDLS